MPKIQSPRIVEVTRGNRVESTHLVDIVVADASGALHTIHGEAQRPVFPRSAVKALQALPLIETGAADKFGLEPRHIALACASHNGEPMHVGTANETITRAGLTFECLECGAHWPRFDADVASLHRAGKLPTALHNNCSGKHSGFLAVCAGEGWDEKGYIGIRHSLQKAVAGVMEEVTGAPHRADNSGIDGCSIPTYAIPLANIATAFAKFGVGEDTGRQRSAAMLRIRDACFAHPEMVAGTDRACTAIMQALPGRAFVKTGAEGVFIAALPRSGLGVALKVHDGATRAAEAAIVEVLESLLELSPTEHNALKGIANPVLKNWNGVEVGEVRPATG